MAQHDLNIANQVPANLRTDLNNALLAIATNHSGTSAPATTYANQWWYDTANDLLKIRNEADTTWITIAEVNQASGEWRPYIGGTKVSDFLDEDNMASNSATAVPTQQSVKAYVDTMAGNQSGSAPIYAARAWANCNGSSGASPTIRAGGNIASFVRTATGRYTVTFTTSMSDANYCVNLTGGHSSSSSTQQKNAYAYNLSTTGFDINVSDATNNSDTDAPYMMITVFR